jgi:hypothetical protein
VVAVTAMTDEPSADAVWLSAQLTIRQHEPVEGADWETGRCRQCRPEGCAQLDWARQADERLRGEARRAS